LCLSDDDDDDDDDRKRRYHMDKKRRYHMDKLKQFTSLAWYDGLIEFGFRFVAKTSEPLLAAGLTVSAADYLSHGLVMAGHPAFALGWAWAQALALESSSGVVFVYSLLAFRDQDKVKGAIYLVLALLLAIVGGGMLLLQVNNATMGSAEVAIPALNIMRVVVSIAYIFLLRAKHIRFTDLQDIKEQQQALQPVTTLDPSILNVLIERLDHLSVTVTQLTSPSLPAIAAQAESKETDVPLVRWDEQGNIETVQFPGKEAVRVAERSARKEPPVETDDDSTRTGAMFASKEAEIAAILQERPEASVEEIAHAANCSVRTVNKWRERLLPERNVNDTV
jgi:hypothetical protein